YRTRMIETAQGDASRFRQVLVEYNKAPAVTRERLYLETMQQIFTSTTKVMVDTRSSGNMLLLPFDKLMQQVLGTDAQRMQPAPSAPAQEPPADARRDASRSREREVR
ncbi:MAG TPA: protease modulator HflK, partial [Burkholderiaceae bacterium]|nr:protease modulator HflK [Burkholderiaceae bacterium]